MLLVVLSPTQNPFTSKYTNTTRPKSTEGPFWGGN